MKTNSLQDLASLTKTRIIRTEYQKLAQSYGPVSLSNGQQHLYDRLLFGLSVYTPEELYTMNSAKKSRIAKTHRKAQDVINIFKQEIMNLRLKAFSNVANDLLSSASSQRSNDLKIVRSYENTSKVSVQIKKQTPEILPAVLFKQLLSSDITTDSNFKCTLSFKELGISRGMIIEKLLESKLLPSNFAAM
jgi:hypothetical protein